MEIRINLAILATLLLAWGALSVSDPVSALDPDSAETLELRFLEDAFAREPSNDLLAEHLASRYLELDRPGLVIAVLQNAEDQVLEDPMVGHRLAQAYEATNRPMDALATAELAAARCARALGTSSASPATPIPAHECGERDYAMLEMHRTALHRMVEWGVSQPNDDPRARLAYDVAIRRATFASVD